MFPVTEYLSCKLIKANPSKDNSISCLTCMGCFCLFFLIQTFNKMFTGSNKIIARMSLAIGYELKSCQMHFHFNYSTKSALLKLYLRSLAISSVTERSLIITTSIQRSVCTWGNVFICSENKNISVKLNLPLPYMREANTSRSFKN